MKKEVLLLAIFLMIFLNIPFLFAENNTAVANAYTCLNNKINEGDSACSTLSSEEKIFSLMSMKQCTQQVINDSVESQCWPGSGCKIKTTAQAIIALDGVEQDTTSAENWLLGNKKIPTDITWYLQIDSNSDTQCTITYDGTSYTSRLGEDKKVTSSAGPCLAISENDYWLKVSPSLALGCYDKEFEVSCDKGFSTNLLFTNSGSSTINVLDTVNSAAADGATLEQIDSFCFSTGAGCDYEGTLLAALALDSVGNDVSSFLPYLITLADENQKYLPNSFLYSLTGELDYRTKILGQQKVNYWRESGDRFYDTAIALYPFQSEEVSQKATTKSWLLSDGVQDKDGCWEGNIRNTAFLLYSIWPEFAPIGDDEPIIDSGDELDCESNGYTCSSTTVCASNNGNVLDGYACSGTYVCCSKGNDLTLCSDLGGEVCSFGQTCSGIEEETIDLYSGEICCVEGICEDIGGNNPPNDNEGLSCDSYGGDCKVGCSSSETAFYSYYCSSSSEICCVENTNDNSSGGSSVWLWILIILILLVVAGIIFKDGLRRFFFKLKSKFGKSGNSSGGRRPPRPGYPANPMISRGKMNIPERKIEKSRKPSGELDDVLKKLKDLGR